MAGSPSNLGGHTSPAVVFQFVGLGGVMASIAAPGPSFSVDGDGDIQTHDGPVDKAKLATVPTTLLGSTERNPEK